MIIPLRRRRQSDKLGSSVPRAEQHLKAACLSISARMSHAAKAAAFLLGMVLL